MSVDAKILSALRGAPLGVSGAELSRQLGMSRAGVWGHIEELRALGYDIEASPHVGYRLIGTPDALHADDLEARLGRTRVVGREIHVFQETTSTNDVAALLARGGAR
jgi:BirA family biotin operon repressor/biotin-[acetyl-CoA-carboxylase] ligase